MIFEINEKKDEVLGRMYKKAMKELNEFYGLNWKDNLPNIIILQNRKEINKFWGGETEDWIVAFAEKRIIFMLDRKNYEKESSHKYSDEEYYFLLKHELGHLFFGHFSKGNNKPAWLNEGTQLFVAGQLKFKKPIDKFLNFAEHYDKWGKEIYQESGFAVEILVKKFGKERLINLIKGLSKIKYEKEFDRLFKRIYGYFPTYKFFNKLKIK
jgi:hypothetical protein